MAGGNEEATTMNAPQNSQNVKEGMRDKLEIAREITQLFNFERYVYIACCLIAVVLLVINAVMLMRKGGGIDTAGLSLLFGASGLITYSIGRLIYMWNKLVDLIFSGVTGRGES